MNQPQPDSIREIQAELDQLAARAAWLSQRLGALASPPTAPPGWVPPVGQTPPPPAAAPAQPVADGTPPPVRPVFTTAPPRPRRPRRSVSLAEIFAILGSLITLIGVSFVLMLPQDPLFSPLWRIGVGVLLAVVAAAVASWQHRLDPRNIGAQALMATGVAAAFLVVLAATVLFTDPAGHGLIPTRIGLVLAGMIGLGGIWIARGWRSQWLAVLAVLGSLLLAPFVASQDLTWGLAFMVVLTIVSAAFQVGDPWPGLIVARNLPTSAVFVTAAAFAEHQLRDHSGVVLALAAMLAVSGLATAIWHQTGSRGEQVASLVSMVFAAAPMLVVAWMGDQAWTVGVTAVLAVGYASVGVLPGRVGDQVRGVAVPLGAVLALFALFRAFDGSGAEYFFLGLAAAHLAAARWTRFRPTLVVGLLLWLIGIIHWLPILGQVWGVRVEAGWPDVVETLLALLATMLGLGALQTLRERHPKLLVYVTWLAAVGLSSAVVVLAGILLGNQLGHPQAWFQIAHATVTVSWLVLVVVLLVRGLRPGTEQMVQVRLAVVLALSAVAKLFLFDLATLPGLVRALAFLAVGILLMGIGTWYNRRLNQSRKVSGG